MVIILQAIHFLIHVANVYFLRIILGLGQLLGPRNVKSTGNFALTELVLLIGDTQTSSQR